jgi:ABC-2 type transport system permease protein
VAAALPSGALGEALRAALARGDFAVGPCVVLLLWAVLSGVAAARWFRWD